MTDSIEDSDVRRVDQNVDPTALSSGDIEDSMPDDFSESAKDAFAKRVADRRSEVSREAQGELVDNISEPGANGSRQLYGTDPETGRNTFVGSAENVEVSVRDDGTVVGTNTNTGTSAEVGSVDLDAGARDGAGAYRREDSW